MIRILTYLFSFIMGRYNSVLKPSTLILVDQLLLRTRKLLMNSMVSLVASLLLTGGIIISLIEFTRQIDLFQMVWPSATLLGGLFLSVISLTALVYSFTSRRFDLRYAPISTPRRKLGSRESFFSQDSQDTKMSRPHSPLEDALSALVLDFVNERKANRAKEEAQKTQEENLTRHPESSAESRSIYENTTLQ